MELIRRIKVKLSALAKSFITSGMAAEEIPVKVIAAEAAEVATKLAIAPALMTAKLYVVAHTAN